MPIGALQSFGAFRASAFNHLSVAGSPTVQQSIAQLYDIYSSYDPLGLPAKQPLQGPALYREMTDFVDNVGNRFVRVQSDAWSILDKPLARKQYVRKALDDNTVLGQQAQRATRSYLHVYPMGTTNPSGNSIAYAPGRTTANNWRIGINVKPDDIALAARRLLPVADRFNNINHIKFSAPALATKPDSVIVYLRQAADYAVIRGEVVQALQGLSLQGSFSPMWNEITAGLAEAAEPPRRGGSFGTYRCLVTHLAWQYANVLAGRVPPRTDFYEVLGYLFDSFGVPQLSPQSQRQVGGAAGWAELQKLFFQASALYDGRSLQDYSGYSLMNR